MSSDEARAQLIGRRVREARLASGLSQSEIGRRWALWEGRQKPYPYMKIANIENGQRKSIGEDELNALAMVLGRTLSYFTDPG